MATKASLKGKEDRVKSSYRALQATLSEVGWQRTQDGLKESSPHPRKSVCGTLCLMQWCDWLLFPVTLKGGHGRGAFQNPPVGKYQEAGWLPPPPLILFLRILRGVSWTCPLYSWPLG